MDNQPLPPSDSKELSLKDIENKAVLPQEPLQKIALCLSGGGFRAASFSLGVLSYLHRVPYKEKPLLEAVKFITSTSGGSITNGFYSASLYAASSTPFDFEKFYDTLRGQMEGESLLATVFGVLKQKDQWTEQGELTGKDGKKKMIRKQRNLINAFAKTYDRLLFKGATLGTIADSYKNSGNKPHLEETAFNTTEFNNGLNFYFQVSGHKNYVRYLGNGYLKFNDTPTAAKLKISDIVASSSCFPGGFEPMVYPYDFVHAGNTDVDALLKGMDYEHNDPTRQDRVDHQPFALMDGGIVDNMGLNCVLVQDAKRQQSQQGSFDLILSCDVTSYFNEPLPAENNPAGGRLRNWTLQGIINLFKWSNVVVLLSLASIFLKIVPVAGYLLLIPSVVFSLVYWIGFFGLKKAKKDENGTAAIALHYLDYFLTLPLKALLPMLRARLSSVSKLVGDLFLKQIRRGQYNYLFDKPAMRDRAIACLVYEFSTAHEKRRLANLAARDHAWWQGQVKDQLMPGPSIQKTVNEARTMGTTLWFSKGDQHKRDQLIATGQLTACYSLIKHIYRLECLNAAYKDHADLQQLKTRLLEDWERFKTAPSFMVDKTDA